jgi:tungstate transport system substrate-binding protein
MPVSSAKFPKVNAKAAQAFADWLVSPEGQSLIATFGNEQYGRSLFVPAADQREKDLLVN